MNKTALQKASIVLAGPMANFILGIILFIIIFISYGKNYTSPIVGNIEKGSPSEMAGLKKYDKILTMNNEKITSFEEIYTLLDENIYENISLRVERNTDLLDINIYPDEKLILWCDNDEEQGVLHTNFKLSGSGEFISITAPNGITIIDSITFPSMEADLSYGRVQDGSLQWDFLAYPSPGQDNTILSLNNEWVVPNEIDIVSAYPNPFNSNISMKIKSNFAEQNQVHIYDIKGEVVFSDVINSTNKGQIIWQWNGKGFNGMNVSTGTYIVRLSTDEGYSTKKISLIK